MIPSFSLVLCGLGILCGRFFTAEGAENADKKPDPVPLRRVLLPAERVPAEMARVTKGVWVQLPRKEFEARVQQAAQADDAEKNPPRLLQAHYQASLLEGNLVGTAEWKIKNPGRGRRTLTVAPFNLAIHQARLQKGLFFPKAAVLGELDGKILACVVEEPGEQSAYLDWSLRGDPRVNGWQFDLKVPASPLASLELSLPAAYGASVERNTCLLSGPFPAQAADRRLWRIDFGKRSQISLSIRAADPSRPIPSLILSQVQTSLELGPDAAQIDFEFKIEVPRQNIRRLSFELANSIQPYEVNLRRLYEADFHSITSWELQPSPEPMGPTSLTVALDEALENGAVQIRCLALPPESGRWNCPNLRLSGAIPRGETLTWRLHPDLQLESWQAGDFRLTKTVTEPGGWQTFTLQDWGLNVGAAPRRPSALIKRPARSFRARQLTWWQIAPNKVSLIAQIDYEVLSGRLFQLFFQLPPNWEVEEVESRPVDLVRHWTVAPGKDQSILVIDLQRPLVSSPGLASRTGPPITLRLRPIQALVASLATTALSFPDVIPMGCRFREGALAISLDGLYQANVHTPLMRSEPQEEGPWENQNPDFYFAYRGEAVAGRLELKLRQPKVRAHGTTQVVFGENEGSAVIRLALYPSLGHPDSIDVYFSAPAAATGPWRTERGKNHVLETRRLRGAEATGFLAFQFREGEVWRFKLAQPLREPLLLAATVPLQRRSSPHVAWSVPLPVVFNADPMEGEVSLPITADGPWRPETRGLRETGSGAAGKTTAPMRTWAYGRLPVELQLMAPDISPILPSVETVLLTDWLTTYVDPAGKLLQHYRLRVWNWRQRQLSLRLPRESHSFLARVDGRWIRPLSDRAADDRLLLTVPIPSGPGGHDLEVVYATDLAPWYLWAKIRAPLPEPPIIPAVSKRTWRLQASFIPWNERKLHLLARTPREVAPGFDFRDLDQEWSEWEMDGRGSDDASFLIFRRDSLGTLGMGLAVILALISWPMRKQSFKVRLGLLLFWIALSWLAYLWLPEPGRTLVLYPALAPFGLLLIWYLAGVRSFERKPRSVRPVAAGAAFFFILGLPGTAAPPDSATVYILPGSNDPEKQTVLTAPDVLEKLQDLAQRGIGGLKKPVLFAASYEGHATEDRAEFKVELRAYCFSDQSELLKLPLGGTQLTEARLDGVLAYPSALDRAEGYQLPLKGRGNHQLQLRFTAPVSGTGRERDLKFLIPELVQSRLSLIVPGNAHYLQDITSRGFQRQDPLTEGGKAQGIRLTADLGRTNTLHVRWRQDEQPMKPATVEVREAYLWHLSPAASRLLGVLQIAAKEGASAIYSLELPQSLEVRSVEAGRLPSANRDEPLPRLRNWTVIESGKTRRLEIELQRPETRAQITLELIPRRSLEPTTALPLPKPIGTVAGEARDRESFLAFRTEGYEAQVDKNLGVRGVEESVFGRLWQAAGMGDPGRSVHAFVFQRGSGTAPFLQLKLNVPPVQANNTQEIKWRVGKAQADVTVTAKSVATNGDLILLEWETPQGLIVAQLQGSDVRNWSQSGRLLQVWLRQPVKETILKITGWLPLTRQGEVTEFALPAFVLQPGQSTRTSVQVNTEEGLELEVVATKALQSVPDPPPSLRQRAYSAPDQRYSGLFRVRPISFRADAQIWTMGHIRDRFLSWSAVVDYRIQAGELRTASIRLRNWPGTEVEFEAAGTIRRRHRGSDSGVWSWTIQAPPGTTGSYRLKLKGSLSLERAGEFPMPDVMVEDVTRVERWLVMDRGIKIKETQGLTTGSSSGQQSWPDEVRRLSQQASLWHVQAADWHMLLQAQTPESPGPNRIVVSEQLVLIPDGAQWLHQANYRLTQDAGFTLSFSLPAQASLLAVLLDGAVIAPLPAPQGSKQLPPFESQGSHWLTIYWVYDAGLETIAKPIMNPPRIGEVTEEAVAWMIQVPPGYQLDSSAGMADPIDAARLGVGERKQEKSGAFFPASLAHLYLLQPVEGQIPRPMLVDLRYERRSRAIVLSIALLVFLGTVWFAASFPKAARGVEFLKIAVWKRVNPSGRF